MQNVCRSGAKQAENTELAADELKDEKNPPVGRLYLSKM
jgi:hypothetical protein